MISMYRKPLAMQWPIWKYVLLMLFLQAIFTFSIWLHRSVLAVETPDLSISDVTYGSGPTLFALWQRWAWKKDNRLLIWLGNLFMSLYIPSLFLGGAISIWRVLLSSIALNYLLISLLLICSGMLVLPWLSSSWAKALHDFQWKISGPMLGLSGIAGIVGALLGMFSTRSGTKTHLWALGILLPLLAVGLTQHFGYEIWRNRPWVNESK